MLRKAPLLCVAALAVLVMVGSANAGIIVDGFAAVSQNSGTVSLNFDASGSDKLVVVVTGEHGFNNDQGKCTLVTYDGVELTEVINRDAQVGGTDTIFNDMWILDNPGTSTGLIEASVITRGSITVFGLSGTASGVGATAISLVDTRTVDLTTTANGSIVIASFGMGGAGNTADVQNVTVDAPLTFATATKNSSRGWDGHVTGYAIVPTAGPGTYSFTGGNELGAHVIAAEFLPVPEPATMALMGLGGLLMVRRRK